MKRDLLRLADTVYDLLVVGGGIHGACVAWDATLRGLSVALVERGDFGHATSSNSLKIVHGGLRYLQDADLGLVREMIRERTAFMRIAPHLVHPLPCVMPTYHRLTRSRSVMRLALAVNDLVGADRNRLEDPLKRLPGGRIVSREECLRLLPGIADRGLTGGALWYDAQMYNSERLTLSFVLSAEALGATVANYLEAVDILRTGTRVVGVRARDVLGDQSLDVRARVVVNATGPWVNRVLDLVGGRRQDGRVRLSAAMNLVTRQIIPEYAAGVPATYGSRDAGGGAAGGSRLLFIAPWRDRSLIGTVHAPYEGKPEDYRVSEEEVQRFLDEVNAAHPGAGLRLEDVSLVHSGLLPMVDGGSADGLRLVRRSQIRDHRKVDGIDGLISVVGVKYTSARSAAQKAVDLVFQQLGVPPPACLSATTPLRGGRIPRLGEYLARETAACPAGLPADVVRHLVLSYGSEYRGLLGYLREDPSWGQRICDGSDVIRAEVVHAVREEMAQRLADVVLRRTELGSAGMPSESCLRACAGTMAAELGWDASRIEREVAEVSSAYPWLGTKVGSAGRANG